MPAAYELITVARRYLALLRDALEMDASMVTEQLPTGQLIHATDGNEGMFGLVEGATLEWQRSPEVGVVVAGDTAAAPENAIARLAVNKGIHGFVAAPVVLSDGRHFGWLVCMHREARHDIGPSCERLVASLATALAEELTVLQARAESRRNRRDQIVRVVMGTGLTMVAQPIVNLAAFSQRQAAGGNGVGESMVGVEALSRFDDPPKRPDRWFADAATLGLGAELELAAVTGALRFLDRLPPSVYVSVNASPALVMGESLSALLARVDARRIVLEITEHTHVASYPELLDHLRSLRSSGVRLAIDDAGAGYASFRHILQLEPDIIKLDRDMITNIADDRARSALVSALVAFASDLRATVVAEGVETSAELECLIGLGVTLGQGYHMARPGPLSALAVA